MSTTVSAITHVQAPNGHPSANKSLDLPSVSATYDDLVRNSALFWGKLYALLGFTSTTLRVPTVGGNTLDLHLLFIEVTSRGGIEKVIKYRKWKEVIAALGLPSTQTSASFSLRKYYFKFLYQLEQVYYFENPVPSVQSTDEATKTLANESPNLEEGIDEPQVGNEIHGLINGKFDSGYLVTMKMGAQELKGVLYHPQTPMQSQQTMETHSASVASSQRRPRKKTKLAVVKPKCHRSGYNFFFAEHHARLRPEFPGQERAITRIIGHMWSNLTESEKQVYQDKGVKDVERYRMEMLEYKSSHGSGAAASTVAQ